MVKLILLGAPVVAALGGLAAIGRFFLEIGNRNKLKRLERKVEQNGTDRRH